MWHARGLLSPVLAAITILVVIAADKVASADDIVRKIGDSECIDKGQGWCYPCLNLGDGAGCETSKASGKPIPVPKPILASKAKADGSELAPPPDFQGALKDLWLENAERRSSQMAAIARETRSWKAAQQSASGSVWISIAATSGNHVIFNTSIGVSPNPVAKMVLASVSKQFTAAGVLILEDKGLIQRTDSIANYLPEWPAWSSLTINDLLNHRTSLIDYITSPAYALSAHSKGIALNELLKLVATLQPLVPAQPLPCIAYSNSNYVILAALIERVTKMSFGDFLQKELFVPLGMNDSFYAEDRRSELAPGHTALGSSLPAYYVSWASGAGGIATTSSDMTRWNRALIAGKFGIARRAIAEMRGVACAMAPQSYALGWMSPAPDQLEHSGLVDGYSAHSILDVQAGTSVVVLSNSRALSGLVTSLARSTLRAIVPSGTLVSPGSSSCAC